MASDQHFSAAVDSLLAYRVSLLAWSHFLGRHDRKPRTRAELLRGEAETCVVRRKLQGLREANELLIAND
jgi:hypothetical protein